MGNCCNLDNTIGDKNNHEMPKAEDGLTPQITGIQLKYIIRLQAWTRGLICRR